MSSHAVGAKDFSVSPVGLRGSGPAVLFFFKKPFSSASQNFGCMDAGKFLSAVLRVLLSSVGDGKLLLNAANDSVKPHYKRQ